MRSLEERRDSGWTACAAAAAVLVFAASTGAASLEAVPACASLSAGDRHRAAEVFDALHPYDGCTDTFSACLAHTPVDPVVRRLAGDVCRRVGLGQDKAAIARALERRRLSVQSSGAPAAIALDERMRTGDASAPVTLVVYACTRCPYCKSLIADMYQRVNAPPLAGKVRMYVRLFPLKSHAGSVEGGLAALAAARQGKFWSFLRYVYAHFDAFSPEALPDWARAVGLDVSAFVAAMRDPKTRRALVESKKEGIRNQVHATPTLFIDGRQYVYGLDPDVVTDVLLEVYERRTR